MADEQLKFKEIIDELEADYLDKDIIQDNKLNFMYDKNIYRVRLPNQKELSQAKTLYHNAKIELIQQSGTMTEKQLRKVLKDKDIDLEKIEEQIKDIDNEMTQLYISLARKKDNEKKAIKSFKEKIVKLKQSRRELAEELAGYLASSIESQAKDKQYEYLTSICTEKYEEKDKKGTWVKVWNSIDDYGNDDTNLTYKALSMFTLLLINS